MDQRPGWVKRVLRRFVLVDGEGSTSPPDHRAYIRWDHGMCCPYHERSFRPWS
jgi:hypothetical protein